MKHIADALVYAVAFFAAVDENIIEDRASINAIESIVGFLQHATDDEKNALAQAAQSAYAAEQAAAYPREPWLEVYENWMEQTFGDDEWQGNQRVA